MMCPSLQWAMWAESDCDRGSNSISCQRMCACYVQQSFCFFHPSLMYAHMQYENKHRHAFFWLSLFFKFWFQAFFKQSKGAAQATSAPARALAPKAKEEKKDREVRQRKPQPSKSDFGESLCPLSLCSNVLFLLHTYLHPYLLTHISIYMQTSCIHAYTHRITCRDDPIWRSF